MKVIDECKKNYFFHRQEADKSNLRIEEAMISLNRGEIDAEALQ
jgi:hypothetical protein